MRRRAALKRTSWWRGPDKPRTDGRRRSPRRENGAASWHRTRVWVLDRAKHLCEAHVAGVCSRRAEHVHHVRLRSRGGSDDPSNLLALCHACHRFIHDNPAWATAQGFMRHSWED